MTETTALNFKRAVGFKAFSPGRLHATSMLVVLAVMFLTAAITIPEFVSSKNISAILFTAAPVGIAAVGLALITLSGNLFVLSLSSTAALSSIVFASTLGASVPLAFLASLAFGAIIGVAQGAIVTAFRTNPIITSIAASSLIGAAGYYLSAGRTVLAGADIGWLGSSTILMALPIQALVFFVIVVILEFFVERSRLGRELRLTGMNRSAADLAGLRSSRAVLFSYLMAGAAAAVAGILIAAQTGAGNMRVGQDLDFSAIAAVLIGGVGIKGGHGRIVDAAVGALFVAVLTNILLVYGFSYEVQLMVKGMAVIFSVMLAAAFSNEKN